jgi:hypothetical protein
MTTQIGILRDGLKLLPQVAAHAATNTPDLRTIFTPQSHEGALDPSREIVVGDRGVGKSFWSSVLKDDAARTAIAPIYPRLHLEKLNVCLGFSEVIGRNEYPSARTLSSLLASSITPDVIWRSVILNTVNPVLFPKDWSSMEWAARCAWVKHNPEKEEATLVRFNEQLQQAGKCHLIIFDALDRLGNDWGSIRLLTRALLTVVLDQRSFSAFRSKVFIRPDMESDRDIWSIRDGSKLKQNIVNLNWSTKDLFGFVWHWFLLDPKTRIQFTLLSNKLVNVPINIPVGEHLLKVPHAILEDEAKQKKLFEALAGKMMGAGSRKGHPYTWIPKHLADARGRVSLRSFIIALRDAASTTPMTAATAMTYDQIKRGVQTASRNRVEQLKEDYGWIEDVLRPLAGLSTPNDDGEFIERWKKDGAIHKILSLKLTTPDCLIPVELEGSKEEDSDVYEKLIDALINIGVAERRDDNRLNVPDLFQVASGMVRKGGVRPIH